MKRLISVQIFSCCIVMQAQSLSSSESNTIHKSQISLHGAEEDTIINQIQLQNGETESTEIEIEEIDECPATNLDKIKQNNKIKNSQQKTGFIKHKNDPYKYIASITTGIRKL